MGNLRLTLPEDTPVSMRDSSPTLLFLLPPLPPSFYFSFDLLAGGDAELELVDSLDPFSEGIVFSVRPPKKSWKNISNLSGGEKTLSSLALVFALHHFKPTPLYVMDEIDAALVRALFPLLFSIPLTIIEQDFKNVSIVANYIKQRTKNAQFVIISLR
jgi:structural maintenance of chromosome 4